MKDLLIYNGRILAETHTLQKGYLLVRDGKISSIGEDWNGIEAANSVGAAGGLEKLDARGLFVCPGLIDMHTHGIRDVNYMESNVEAMVQGLSLYASFGVTRVLPSTIANPYDAIIAQIKRLSDELQNALHALSQQVYAQQQTGYGNPSSGGNGGTNVEK